VPEGIIGEDKEKSTDQSSYVSVSSTTCL